MPATLPRFISGDIKVNVMKNEESRFWEKVAIRGPEHCWNWTRSAYPYGYGAAWFGGKQRRAHRVAYRLQNGEIHKGAVIRHTCDNPSCCNPAHLLLGTHKDNTQDAVKRGRMASGSRHGRSKLTEEQIAEIRRRYTAYCPVNGRNALAIEFRVHRQHIMKIVMGTRWSSTTLCPNPKHHHPLPRTASWPSMN